MCICIYVNIQNVQIRKVNIIYALDSRGAWHSTLVCLDSQAMSEISICLQCIPLMGHIPQ